MSTLYLGAIGCARGALPPGMQMAVMLPAEEIRRADSLRRPGAKRRFLAGRWLARTMLSGLMDLPAASVPISISPSGRPVLARGAAWDFSISHSGDLAVCAVADLSVGVDLERVTPDRDLLGVARHCFHPGEVEDVAARLAAGGSRAAAARFCAYWTLKEADLKRRGGGVWDMRRAPAFTLGTGAGVDTGEGPVAWYCLQIPPRDSLPCAYVLAVSAGGPTAPHSLNGPALRLRFLLAEDPRPRLLFGFAGAGQQGGRGGTRRRLPG